MRANAGTPKRSRRSCCADLVDRMTVRQGVAQPDVEGQVLANLPDQADEARTRFLELAKFLS